MPETPAHSWEVSKLARWCPEKYEAFQSPQIEGKCQRMATGAISTCLTPAEATLASVAALREHAGVSFMKNISHYYSDLDWLMNIWLKYKLCWVDWCHWQLSHMKLKAVSVCYYIRGKAMSGKKFGTWQISFNHIWQFLVWEIITVGYHGFSK